MFNLLKKVFGTKQDKDIKLLTPLVEEINEHYERLNSLSDEELKAKTEEFKQIIKERSQDLEEEKEKLRKKLRDEALDVIEITDTRDRLKQIEKELFIVINETLDEIMPEAFAVVKQACRRLKDEGFSYEYAGNRTRWEMVPYDVQLMGGVVLHQGRIAEMATGEGKTLVAVLPLYLNALAGKGAHLVTVNDYLAERDADWMRPVYEYLGLSVAAIKSNMEPYTRKKLYNADITYGTNNEFGFDYLRDNMVADPEHMVQREHWYSIVDEVDSVLIDEARTPLIISGPVGQSSDQKFDEMNPRVRRLVDAQTRLVNQMVSEAENLLKTSKEEDRENAGILLLRAYHGLPKHKKLSKVLQEPEYQKLKHETEMFFLKDKGSRMHEIDDELFYVVEEKNHQIDMTDKGRELITAGGEDPEMFVLPDIAAVMSDLEGDEEVAIDEKQRKIDEINLLYAERSDRIHTVNQLLRAYSLYEKDVEYVVQEGKVMIVDEHTGRILEGRRYSEGLHQAIEAKEHVKVERDTQTMATITLQNYFRLYHKLAGMTGTADTEAAEFEKIYKLDVVVVPTNRPIVRDDRDDLIFRTKREKYNALVDEVEKEIKMGRAVLLGTASVEVSETLSKIFKRRGFKHNVLNAKQHAREADIVANAGKKGALTIATNMAGRGTDIKLDNDVRNNGGLAIIGSERHDARRIDRQLRGRAGRQGDPGSSQFFISLEDNLMRLFGGERVSGIMQKLNIPEGEPIQHSMITKNVERAQKKVEENNFGIRKRLLEYDDVMNQQREVIYARRKNALLGERLKGDIFEYIDELVDEWYQIYKPENDLKGFKNQVRTILLSDPNITDEEFEKESLDKIKDKVIAAADAFYKRKEEMLGSEFMSKLETIGVLQTIDEKWKDHLRVMDDLKEGIHLRSYGQKDPLLEYKGEAFKLFVELIKEINREATHFVFKFFPKIVEREVHQKGKAPKDSRKFDDSIPQLRRRQTTEMQSLQFSQPSVNPSFINNAAQQGLPEQQEATGPGGKPLTHKRSIPKVGRNDLCPCGSGKKYKHCHGR
jgi:preprotein translocase subunit SecA